MTRRGIQYTSSPLLASRTPVWRSKFVVGAIALGFTGLVARAAYIQVYANDFFIKQGEVRFARTIDLPADRGRILDRNGLILGSSVPAPSIWAIPEDVDLEKGQLSQLAKLLDMPVAELSKKLADEDKTFVWIKRQVDADIAKKIAELNIKGIYQRKEYKRQYPEGEAAAHIVGFTNVEDNGQEGVELMFNKELLGRAGMRHVIKDRLGRAVENVGEVVPPVPGRDLQLSIDSKVQFFAYQKLRDAVTTHKAKAGSVVVLDAITGEVLALANYPSYTPDKRKNLTGEQLRNRALTDTFEPGSVMKPFTVGLALETGRVKPTTMIDTAPGTITITGATIRDSHPHGMLTVEQVLQVSSNVGTTKLAMQMPASEMWQTFSQAGFGQKPQVEFPGVVSGRLRPYKSWRPIEQATVSYGYGMSASLFQMVRSYTVFSHGGQIIPATLLKTTTPAVGVQVFSEQTAARVRHMLKMAAGPGGTAPKAQTIGYSVGGKSGTAYKQIGKGYGSDGNRKYRSWFVGMAPIEEPRIIVGVMLDEPSAGKYYGGEVAAPVFSETVQQTLRMLGVQPDIAVQPHIQASAVEESF
ncbi:FtsI Cell division protein FtsI/penicillin-binding protein 2 [Comamonadaceae bacterium]|uniref:Peptidoglycan D,D-transpeptidase FtsI n=1 Tax=Rhodoferax potami TaxID=3068338 RepID=A0ABU3KNL8_9BURK|nr:MULTISPECIES: penicillin-binding protein 2 [unclassified Rhodoferax]MDT7519401.1 penicillin-binding protein 2 [Rhodoferax sp. TBRC 17660]MDT7523304.1 penicillin-binding protein 2 [Rhodoferax sp. TBRC 17198]